MEIIRFKNMDSINHPLPGCVGYTFRKPESSVICTLIDNCNTNKESVRVIRHNFYSGDEIVESWVNDNKLMESFSNGTFIPYYEDCEWLDNYYM